MRVVVGSKATVILRSAATRDLFFALAFVAACSTNKGTQVKGGGETFADSADQVFYGVEAPLESGGVKRGTLFADTMYVMNDQTRFDFRMGHIEFNTATGVPDGSMRANRGRFDRRQEVLEGWGNVIVKSADGRTLKSPHIIFNRQLDKIWSDTTFEYTQPGKVTTGKGFETNQKMTRTSCKANCEGSARVAIPR